MEREIDRFAARADDGTVYTVVEFQEFLQNRPVSGASTWVKGMRRMELDDGSPVNYIDENTFKIVATDEIIRKIA